MGLEAVVSDEVTVPMVVCVLVVGDHMLIVEGVMTVTAVVTLMT